ncbi:MAG: ABC transporter permease [Candidatus Hodarchaeales archaeon]|jgi:ABC-type antimicrobial peptide transport system permease subunit
MPYLSKNILKTIIRDLYQRKTRSLTILISLSMVIAFPVAFINSGPSLSVSLDEESEQAHLAHLEIFFLGISDEVVNNISDVVNPTEINGRIRLQGIVEYGQEKELKDDVFIISTPESGFPTVNIPKLQEGDYARTPGTCMVLESYAKAVDIKIDDEINIKGKNTTLPLTVTGFVTSTEFMSYNIFGNGVIFISYNDTKLLGGYYSPFHEKIYNDLIIFFDHSDSISVDYLEAKVFDMEKFLESDLDPFNNPLFIWFSQKTSVRAALAEGTELVGTYLGAASTFTVLITGFIILIIMNRYINEEKKIIGVYHSFGFSRNEIVYIYAGRAFLLAMGGIIIGSIFATILLSIISTIIGENWGVNEVSMVISLDSFIFFWMFSILCSLIFSIIPSIRAANLTPYEALREIKKIGIPGKGLLSKIAAKLQSVPKMAIRTLARNRVRTSLTILAIVGSMALSIALLSAFSSVNYTIDNYFENNLRFNARIEYYDFQNSSELNSIENNDAVLGVEPNLIYLTNPLDTISEVIMLRGLPNNSNHFTEDPIEVHSDYDGLGLSNDSNYALISQRISSKLNLTIGDDLTVRWKLGGPTRSNLTLEVMGIIRDFEDSVIVYVGLPYLRSNMIDKTNYISTITVKLENKQAEGFIDSQLSRKQVNFVSSLADIRERTGRIVDSQIFVVALTVILGFLVAFISVFNTQYISIIERERDISIMQAFGYSKSFFLFEFLIEIIILVPTSLFLATIASRPVAQIFLDLIEDAIVRMDYFLGQGEIIISLIFILLTVLTAAVIPAIFMINSKKLARILRIEE